MRSRSAKPRTSPATVVTFLLMKAAASFSSFSRRPVITTCAPSSTKRLAVAKPIPLLPPVITAIFPANFCPWLLRICFLLFVFRCFYVEFTLFLQSQHSHRLLLLLEQILEDELTPRSGRVRAPARHPRLAFPA